MNTLRFMVNELIGLFVDDKFLAAGIALVVGAAWLLQTSGLGSPLLSGALLFFGCLIILVVSAVSERKP
jgi:hypothetical protein